jgi:hypothetical protein
MVERHAKHADAFATDSNSTHLVAREVGEHCMQSIGGISLPSILINEGLGELTPMLPAPVKPIIDRGVLDSVDVRVGRIE